MAQLFPGFVLMLSLSSAINPTFGTPLTPGTACLKTKVAVLGAGTAGITAAVSDLFISSQLIEPQLTG